MGVADQTQVLCPQCDSPMKKRKGGFGEFYGCSNYPSCRGTRKIGEETKNIPKIENPYQPITKLPGSDEQEAIWDYALKGTSHIIINAAPGTGKTWTGIQYCLRAPKDQSILLVAFNKHIAKEAQGKLQASKLYNVKAATFHSVGLSILRQNFKKLPDKADDEKMTKILESLSPMPALGRAEWRRTLNLAEKLAGLAKNYLIDYEAENFPDEMYKIGDHHGLEMNGKFRNALDLVPPALEEGKRTADVKYDFDDMIWIPIVLNLPAKQYDIVIPDESQDLNGPQHDLMFKVLKGRAMIIGDKHQAIYGFRGASTESLQILEDRLGSTPIGVKSFPLTITRRCPQLHVRLAKNLFPEIQAMPDAPLGEILQMPEDKAISEMKPGDMVICRVNKHLISAAYKLIRRGLRPQIKGRDIGKGLIQLIDKLEKDYYAVDILTIDNALNVYEHTEQEKLRPLGDKAEGRLGALQDKCDCLREFIWNSSSILDIRQRIDTIFTDQEGMPSNVVTLGTIHRTKGLESARVFVLAPDLIPHPAAKKDWERIQETNAAWIASTRAKYDNDKGESGTIIFCGKIPPIYSGEQPTPPIQETHDQASG